MRKTKILQNKDENNLRVWVKALVHKCKHHTLKSILPAKGNTCIKYTKAVDSEIWTWSK